MKILVIGSGAREDAICQALQKNSQNVVFCAPGNDGMKLSGIKTISIEENDFERMANFAQTNSIDFTVVGPEEPLVNGIVDFFKRQNLKIFGPNQQAAQVEGSKTFTKRLMADAGIPTAQYQEFTKLEGALKYLKSTSDFPIVIKADGLAAGKGVFIANDLVSATETVTDLLAEHKFNTKKVVIEEFLEGEEFSLMAFVDHKRFYPMPLAQDYKKILDGDLGPNTGGMGAVCPVLNISKDIEKEAIETVLKPFVTELYDQGIKYTGILYAGLILTKKGIKVIEFNARFGDPETEVVLPRLESDLSEMIFSILNHKKIESIKWRQKGLNLGVFAVSKGYPTKSVFGSLGDRDNFKNCSLTINYAAVKREQKQLFSHGGRLYLMQAQAESVEDAQKKVYQELEKMDQTNIFYRRDIGKNSI
ncbi:phosphoribosylamine--glycine ligase [Companilactobacillus kimchii]|uniref:Phosphoribosylamine--glycine ligase n=2 Tax=Companilactobacillus kimchii TaxID=2801452 RepID=A0ABR5NQ94_9LACO|nr:phosphoribosylamine--glycine ligase [Companilactobacillus kimchii]KAE9562801.1 phosphoribosylamine--glycine ligase [Companilactobacillus kimchii]KRK49833.1 phosphoribosylamine--glycine ligase (phosphoribosylglycinamide synthetase) [Companilactobacillus kimchii DSM 13961 = JCM 10707]OWF33200.1 Phosphoribosylamine--glycine ligase [Companilactobacillus kimchii]GEO46715.1 phosphoribosylamine--glycine ligase [Companilactobacillus paralimentarius]